MFLPLAGISVFSAEASRMWKATACRTRESHYHISNRAEAKVAGARAKGDLREKCGVHDMVQEVCLTLFVKELHRTPP